jgi:hypothetical protein
VHGSEKQARVYGLKDECETAAQYVRAGVQYAFSTVCSVLGGCGQVAGQVLRQVRLLVNRRLERTGSIRSATIEP